MEQKEVGEEENKLNKFLFTDVALENGRQQSSGRVKSCTNFVIN
jgi:hypothetical protein